jgi:DNA-binding transcriptional regulator GbsR (MarR family)
VRQNLREKRGKNSLESRIDELVRKINLLEEELRKERELNRDILRELAVVRSILSLSSDAYKTSRKISLLSESLKAGPLARDMTEILISEGPLNISQLTNLLREIRGRASRKTVAKKLRELMALGIIDMVEGKKSEKLFKVKSEGSSG